MTSRNAVFDGVAENGFAIIPNVLSSAKVVELISHLGRADDRAAVRRRGSAYAIRNLLDVVPEVRRLAQLPRIQSLVREILGDEAVAVRGTLFDKTREANWKVPWHQDLTIAVKERKQVPGFTAWSTKAGVLHVQPPVSVLKSMLAVRVHLDECGEENGALRVIPGSHLHGRLTIEQLDRLTATPSVSCIVPAGGVLLMRPLLLHASSPCERPLHRRVIHLDFASCRLPGGVEWYAGQF